MLRLENVCTLRECLLPHNIHYSFRRVRRVHGFPHGVRASFSSRTICDVGHKVKTMT